MELTFDIPEVPAWAAAVPLALCYLVLGPMLSRKLAKTNPAPLPLLAWLLSPLALPAAALYPAIRWLAYGPRKTEMAKDEPKPFAVTGNLGSVCWTTGDIGKTVDWTFPSAVVPKIHEDKHTVKMDGDWKTVFEGFVYYTGKNKVAVVNEKNQQVVVEGWSSLFPRPGDKVKVKSFNGKHYLCRGITYLTLKTVSPVQPTQLFAGTIEKWDAHTFDMRHDGETLTFNRCCLLYDKGDKGDKVAVSVPAGTAATRVVVMKEKPEATSRAEATSRVVYEGHFVKFANNELVLQSPRQGDRKVPATGPLWYDLTPGERVRIVEMPDGTHEVQADTPKSLLPFSPYYSVCRYTPEKEKGVSVTETCGERKIPVTNHKLVFAGKAEVVKKNGNKYDLLAVRGFAGDGKRVETDQFACGDVTLDQETKVGDKPDVEIYADGTGKVLPQAVYFVGTATVKTEPSKVTLAHLASPDHLDNFATFDLNRQLKFDEKVDFKVGDKINVVVYNDSTAKLV